MAKSVGAFLGLVLACALLLAAINHATRSRIEENRAQQFVKAVQQLLGSDDDLPAVHWQQDVWRLCNGRALVRGSTRGYGGPIEWLAAVSLDHAHPHLLGMQITGHQETPGIADFVSRRDDPWLQGLLGRDASSLDEVATVTGATITSRAVLTATRSALNHPGLAQPETPPCQR